jgi:tRNA nucleotidyltransferase (CCA-adding enzyme)
MQINIPPEVGRVIAALEQNGYEAHIVGGCVRDSILGVEPKDWDICTSALPEQTVKCFPGRQIIETGLKHGTVTVIIGDKPFEITTYRKDGAYSDSRRPDDVEFVGGLKEDLSRRDFTVNALAYNPNTGLADYFNGTADLKSKVIKCVGNPEDRFNEDALRVMRAVRFAVCLDFDISKDTIHAIWNRGQNLDNISAERKRDELVKILKGLRGLDKNTAHYQKLCRMTEYIIKRIIPEFQELAQITHNNPYHYADVFTHTMDLLYKADTDDTEILLAALFHDVGKMKARIFNEKRLTNHYHNHAAYSVEITKAVMGRLRFDNKTAETVLRLVEAHDYVIRADKKCAKRLLNKLGYGLCVKLLKLQLLDKAAHRWNGEGEYREWVSRASGIQKLWDEIIENNEAFMISDLAVNGDDVLALGIPRGVMVGKILRSLMEAVIEEKIDNDREILLEYIRKSGLLIENDL